MAVPKRLTRKQLLSALRELQTIIGQIGAVYGNDRAPDRADKMHVLVERGFNVALNSLSTDPPEEDLVRNKHQTSEKK